MQSVDHVGTVEVTLFIWSVHRSPDRRLQELHGRGLKKADWKLSESYSSATFISTVSTTSTIVTSTSPHSSRFLVSLGWCWFVSAPLDTIDLQTRQHRSLGMTVRLVDIGALL